MVAKIDYKAIATKIDWKAKVANTDYKAIAKKKSKKVLQFTLGGELVKEWESTQECGRNGYQQQKVSDCCNGKRKTHKGYKWCYA